MTGVGRLAARLVFAVLLVIVTWLTLTPSPEQTESSIAIARWIASVFLGAPALSDKVAHFLAYAALGASAQWAQLTPPTMRYAAPAILLALYGVVLEFGQGAMGVRSPEIADAAANAAGAICGVAFAAVAQAIAGRFTA
ncbi:MAG: VanZ family protein [Pseudomonadota bacterium]